MKKNVKLVKTPKYQSVAAVIVIAVAAILGYFIFRASHAASPYVSTEAESGVLTGSGANAATVINGDATASGNSYVQFGSKSGSGHGVVPTGVSGNWTLDIDDEFANDSSLNTKLWTPDWYGNGNVQNNTTMESSNVSVSGGTLNLTVNGGAEGTGGIVETDPTDGQPGHTGFVYTYGFAEARIYLPASSNNAIANWPAWWELGENGNWPVNGEIDIMEGLSGAACYHFQYPGGGPGGCASGNYTGWHIYGANWQPGSVTYYYDGVEVGQITSGITSTPMYLILENSTGPYGGTVVTPDTMKVSYVRVWQ